jgi:hypothetical protein
LKAAKAGDDAGVAAASARWSANADEIADFLNKANPNNWPKATLRAEMHHHLDLTLQEATARLHGDWAADIAAYDKVHEHILGMADVLSSGIQKQFPGSSGHERGGPRVSPAPDRARAARGRVSVETAAAAFRGFMESLDLDLTDPNLAGTADRVARAYREMLSGLRSPEPTLSTFPNAKKYRGIVSVTDIPFYSICAHHFLPFFRFGLGRIRSRGASGRSFQARARRGLLCAEAADPGGPHGTSRISARGTARARRGHRLGRGAPPLHGDARRGETRRDHPDDRVRGTLSDERLQEQFFERMGNGGPSNRSRRTG